jgi:hypothetical protein
VKTETAKYTDHAKFPAAKCAEGANPDHYDATGKEERPIKVGKLCAVAFAESAAKLAACMVCIPLSGQCSYLQPAAA